jgi:hypothetical protein
MAAAIGAQVLYSAPLGSSLLLILGLSFKITLNRELWTLRCPLYSMKPNLRNLFMNEFTRDLVVPIISASRLLKKPPDKPLRI